MSDERRRLLVTGGAGFIGSHLCDRLLADGHRVIVLDDLSTGRMANLEHLEGRRDVEVVVGSILNDHLVDDLASRCDAVFHLAAAVGVKLIVERPLESLRTNIVGSEIVLEKAHKYGRPVLVTSTSEIYGKNTSDRLHEDDDRILGSPLKSRWSYSSAKAIEEVLAYTYWRERGLPTVIVRLFNTVGPRQTGRYGMVVPRFVSQAIAGEPITVYGTGEQSRVFCAVEDVVDALAMLIDTPEAAGRVLNVGGREEITMRALAERVAARTGSSSPIVTVPYEEAYEEGFEDMMRRIPAIEQIHDLIGWEPTQTLDDILDGVIASIRASDDG